MWRVFTQGNERLTALAERVNSYPGWVVRYAVIAALLTILLPLMILAFVAGCVGVIVFMVLLGFARMKAAFARGRDEGNVVRRNVRVVDEDGTR